MDIMCGCKIIAMVLEVTLIYTTVTVITVVSVVFIELGYISREVAGKKALVVVANVVG